MFLHAFSEQVSVIIYFIFSFSLMLTACSALSIVLLHDLLWISYVYCFVEVCEFECALVCVIMCTLLIHFTVVVYGLGFSQTDDASVSVSASQQQRIIQFSSLSSKYLYSKVKPSFLR